MRWSENCGWIVEMKDIAGFEEDVSTGRMFLSLVEHDGRKGKEISPYEGRKKAVLGTYPAGIVVNDMHLVYDEEIFLANHPNLVEYDGNYLTVYNSGKREPTEKERLFQEQWLMWGEAFMKENPSVSIYTLPDHKDKFLNQYGYDYLDWIDLVAGKHFNHYDFRVLDRSVKGSIHARYAVSFSDDVLIDKPSEFLEGLRVFWNDVLSKSKKKEVATVRCT